MTDTGTLPFESQDDHYVRCYIEMAKLPEETVKRRAVLAYSRAKEEPLFMSPVSIHPHKLGRRGSKAHSNMRIFWQTWVAEEKKAGTAQESRAQDDRHMTDAGTSPFESLDDHCVRSFIDMAKMPEETVKLRAVLVYNRAKEEPSLLGRTDSKAERNRFIFWQAWKAEEEKAGKGAST